MHLGHRLWLPTKFLLQNLEHVATVPITPMRNQLEFFGVLFDEAGEECDRLLLALDLFLALISMVMGLVAHCRPHRAWLNSQYNCRRLEVPYV